jgi:hypothetical protein
MTRARSLRTALPVVLMLACGPTIEPPQDETEASSGGSGDSVTTTATSTSTSTSTSASTSTATSSGDDVTGSPFLILPDGGGCAVSGDVQWRCYPCGLFAQDCPRGEKCMPWANDGGDAWNATRCSPVSDDPGQPGDACTVEGSAVSGIDSCDFGAMCWTVDPETHMGTCVALCEGNAAAPLCRDEGASCVIANDGALVLCLPRCDPLQPDACPTAQACTAIDEDPVCIPDVGVVVHPCGESACDPGETCLAADALAACMGFGCCTPWCDGTAADPDAPCAAEPAHACQPYYEPGAAPPGLEHLGACRLPT